MSHIGLQSWRVTLLDDRGFLVAEEVNAKGAHLKMQSFTKETTSAKEFDESRPLECDERVIGRLTIFSLFQHHSVNLTSRFARSCHGFNLCVYQLGIQSYLYSAKLDKLAEN